MKEDKKTMSSGIMLESAEGYMLESAEQGHFVKKIGKRLLHLKVKNEMRIEHTKMNNVFCLPFDSLKKYLHFCTW